MAALEAMMIFAIGKQKDNRAAFTLVELVLVMTVMVVAIGVVFPSLKGFFHGRNLDNEARQFLSLTRLGRSRAIAEGVPVELWINQRQAKYGLQALSAYTETKTDPKTFTVDQNVRLTVSPPLSLLTHSNVWTQKSGQVGALTKIRFQPDGFISDTSPQNIYFQQPDTRNEIWLAENPTHTRYEIKDGIPPR
jgi:type II secretion system protein H